MDIFEYLVSLTREEAAPREILNAAARAIAAELRADSCRVFLRRFAGPLALSASSSDTLDEEGAAVALAARAVAEVALAAAETASGSGLAAPLLSRALCLGAIVVERAESTRRLQDDASEKLSAIAAQLVELVQGAKLVEIIRGVAEGAAVPAGGELSERTLDGSAASPGIAIGVASFRHAFPKELVRSQGGGSGQVELERNRKTIRRSFGASKIHASPSSRSSASTSSPTRRSAKEVRAWRSPRRPTFVASSGSA